MASPPINPTAAPPQGTPMNGSAPAHEQHQQVEARSGVQPMARPSYPGLTSAEKSLFPNSMPVRQTLPSIHSFSPAPAQQAPPQSSATSPYPPPSAASEHKPLQQQQNRYSTSASPYGAASLPPISAPSNPSATTPTPPIIPPAASPKLTASSSSATPVPHSAGSPPLSRPNLPGLNQISPRLSSAAQPAPSNAQSQQGRDANSPFGANGAGARRNPMSVSSMLSGPPRASGIAAFTPSSAGPPQPPVLPPMASAQNDSTASRQAAVGRNGSPQESPGGGGQGGTVRSPILSRPTASGSNLPSFRPPSTHELKPATKAPSPALEKKEATPSATPQAQPSKTAYPSLPTAFARESPYSTAPPSGSSTTAPPAPPSQPQQANKAAPAQPFFPNLAGYRPPPFPSNPSTNSSSTASRPPPYGSPVGGSSSSSSAANPPQQGSSYPWQASYGNSATQGSPKLEHSHSHPAHSHSHSHSGHSHASHSHSGHTHSHPPPSASTSSGHSHPTSTSTHQHAHSHGGIPHSHSHSHSGHTRRPSGAASIAHSPQANRTPGGGLASVKPSPASVPSTSTLNGKGTSGSGAGAGARFSSLMDGPYGQSIRENGPGIMNKQPPPSASSSSTTTLNGASHHHHHHQQASAPQPPQKRRRSETQSSIAPNLQPTTTKQARTVPAVPSAPAPPLPPPFTHTDLRLATIRPPLVSIDNSAVDKYLSKLTNEFTQRGQPRPFAGRKIYDPYCSPASLLDGATLRTCVGGSVQLVIPTSLLLDPPTSSSNGLMTTTPLIRSSCSVPPISPPPIALSYGPPSEYTGSPLPQTSHTTPLSLPPHLFDLPFLKTRQIWGTDIYTDDSDVLGMLVHSGWVRLARRERKLRAGEKGAGEEAIRRAKERIEGPEKKRKKVSRVVNEVAQHPSAAEGTKTKENEEEEDTPTPPPKNLLVTLGIVPALVRYQGMERGGLRSRNWGNGHDGVSLKVEAVEPFNDTPVDHGRKSLRTNASITSHQLSFDRKLATNPFPNSFLPPLATSVSSLLLDGGEDGSEEVIEDIPIYPRLNRPKRFKIDHSTLEQEGENHLEVTDTFVLDFKTGTGRFVGLEREEEEGLGRRIGEDRMEIEV
ncbi:uncharacterized protein JCM6883_006992 [Sporobolomyces salmoneus]|uniref:uncharacterized protein n=1 Tax=Sporobolomyces salmoneus TaxID=183962 RepID=UPI0031716C12